MAVYITITIFSMFMAKYAVNVRGYKDLKSTYKILCVSSFLPFFLVSALRYNVGTDYWFIYEKYFYYINEGSTKFSEEGFNLLNKIAYWIYADPAVMFAIVSLIIYIFVFIAIFQQSDDVCFSILVFVISAIFFNSMNQIRQSITMAIFLYAMKYIWSRDKWKYFIWIAIAFTMHTSAIFYIPLYFMYGIKAKPKDHLKITLLCLVSFPIIKRLIILVISHTKYSWYLGSLFDENNFYLLGFLFACFLLFVSYYYYFVGEHEEDKQYNLMQNMMFLGMLALLFSSTIPQSDRIYYAFTFVQILFIPKVVQSEAIPRRRILLYLGLFSAYVVKLLYDIYVNGWYYVIPYQTLFSK